MKLVHLVFGVPVALFGATWLFWAGYAWDAARPHNWPSYTLKLGFFHHTFAFPDGFGAKYRAVIALGKVQAEHTKQVIVVQRVISKTAQVHEVAAQEHIRVVTKEIIHDVPVYVSAAADAKCVVPTGFVRIHDAAAAGMSPAPDTPGEPNDSPSGIDLSTVGETIATNYGAALGNAEELTAFQAWYKAQMAAAAP